MVTLIDSEVGHTQISLDTDTVFKGDNDFTLIYTLDEDTISYGSVKRLMNHGIWRGLFSDGTLRFTSEYKNGLIHGASTHYHKNGEVKSRIEHTLGKRSGTWSSFYDTKEKMSIITWNSLGMPITAEFFSENGALLLSKNYVYDATECAISIKRFYRTGSRLESYTTYISNLELEKLLTENGLEQILDITPHFGLPFSKEGRISGYYYRHFNSGKLWMHLEFDEGKLLEVFTQNTANGSEVDSEFNKGTGTLVHFHHFGDTAAIINYKNGLLHGSIKYFYSRNNTYAKGNIHNGYPSEIWTFYSFSGKTKYTLDYTNDTLVWCLYGPKSNKHREYPVLDGLLTGQGKEFDFYDQTSAQFSFENGLLDGSFTRWLNGNVTRFGSYTAGEQVGDWVTPGLFNPVSHTTRFSDKSVITNSNLLPTFEFNLAPRIEMPKLKLAKEYAVKAYSRELELYSKDQIKTVLLELPDSDDIRGTTFMELSIDENGNLVDLSPIKSPSLKDLTYAKEFIIKDALFSTQYVFGLPNFCKSYVIVEHYRN